ATKGESFLASPLIHGSCVPDLRRPVPADRSQALAVGATRQASEVMGVSAEGENHFTGRRVPDLHGLIDADRGEAPAAVDERHAEYLEDVSVEGVAFLPGGHIPDLHGP